MQHRRAWGPLPDRRAPVICSREPLHLVGTATWMDRQAPVICGRVHLHLVGTATWMLLFSGSWCKLQQCEA